MFQFYLSSIKSPGRLPQEGVDDGFNSTLVQLKVEHSLNQNSTQTCFNSYLSSIKSIIGVLPLKREFSSFNSTLVQLKEYIHDIANVTVVEFQFYLSSIKRHPISSIYVEKIKFQFYLSSIKSLIAGID